MSKRIIGAATVAVAALTTVTLTAPSPVGAAATTTTPIKTGLKIAVMPKSINNGYFTAWNQGAQKACAEIKAKCDYLGPTQATGPAQVTFINQVIQKQYQALVISAADQNAVVPSLKKAQAKGIVVVTSDADVDPSAAAARTVMIKPASDERIGAAEVDWIAAQIGNKGEVAILSAAATAANQNTWIAAMKKQLLTKYPNVKLVGTYYGDDDATKSTQQFDQILTEHPNIAGIISPTTVGILAAAQEAKAKGSKVKITGLGLPSQMAPYILDGTVTEMGLWNPIDLGYVAVYAAAQAASGSFKGAVGQTFSAGGKTYTVAPGTTVFLGDPFKFDKTNIVEFAKIY